MILTQTTHLRKRVQATLLEYDTVITLKIGAR